MALMTPEEDVCLHYPHRRWFKNGYFLEFCCSSDSLYGCWVSLFPFLADFMTSVVGRQYPKVYVSSSFIFSSIEDDCLTINTERELKKKKRENSALGWLLVELEKAY